MEPPQEPRPEAVIAGIGLLVFGGWLVYDYFVNDNTFTVLIGGGLLIVLGIWVIWVIWKANQE